MFKKLWQQLNGKSFDDEGAEIKSNNSWLWLALFVIVFIGLILLGVSSYNGGGF